LGSAILQQTAGRPLATILLVAHHLARLADLSDLPSIDDQQLAEMGAFGAAGWPGIMALTARMFIRPSTTLLDAIRAHGHYAIVRVEQLPPTIPSDLLRSILRDAADYPLAWLLAAEHRLAQDFDEPHLARIADQQHWFNRSD